MNARLVGLGIVIIVIAVAAYFVLSGGQGQTASQAPTATATGGGGSAACPRAVLTGSGSTFVWPAMNSWASRFHQRCPGVTVQYSGGGSGKGQTDIVNRLVDFACSDPPLARKFYEEYKGRIMQFPVVLGAVVVTYNLPGLNSYHLNFTGEVLAKIYLGEIRYWDDPAIKKLNPAVADRLPHKQIVAVHRSDASGTTQIFTTFLYKSSHGIWPKSLVGKTIEWPVDKRGAGVGEQGNPGVAETVKRTPYSIGYIEWAYAIENNLPVARVENPSGRFVLPSRESVSAAFKLAKPPSPLDDWTTVAQSFVYSSASPDAYPIAGQTFMIVWRSGYPGNKCLALRKFIEFIASDGQSGLPKGYAPLPQSLRSVALEAAKLLECG